MILLFVYHDIVIHHLGNIVNYSEFTFNYNTLLTVKKEMEVSTKGDIHIHIQSFDDHEWNTAVDSDTEGTLLSHSY